MKNLFKSALVACAAIGLMASCSKTGTETENEGRKDGEGVFVQLLSDKAGVRGVGKHVGEISAVLNDGTIYFLNGVGGIVDYVTLKSGANTNDAYDAGTKTIGLTKAAAGFMVENLPASVNTVFIAGNLTNAAISYPTSGNISQLKTEHQMHVRTQYDDADPAHGVNKVALSGSAGILATGTAGEYTSSVVVRPLAARLEIARLTGAGRIKSFTLKGIYINNFHRYSGIEGMVVSAPIFNGGIGSPSKSEFVTGSASYPINGPIANDLATDFVKVDGAFDANGIATTKPYWTPVASATVDDVWGYNVWAPEAAATNGISADLITALPHIIVKVEDVVVNVITVTDPNNTPNDSTDDVTTVTEDAVTYAGEKWLTIRNYYLSGIPTPLARLVRGNVYRLGDTSGSVTPTNPDDDGDGIIFDETDLTDDPEMGTIKINVTATVSKWVNNITGYDYN